MDTGERLYFRVKVSIDDSITYFQVFQLKKTEITKKIVNELPFDVEITSGQYRNEPVQVVAAKSELYYTQNYPNKAGSLARLTFYFDKDTSSQNQANDFGWGLNYSKDNKKEKVELEVDMLLITNTPKYFQLKQLSKFVQLSVKFLGTNTVIELKLVSNKAIAKTSQSRHLLDVRFRINVFDISFLYMQNKNPRQEIMNMYFSDIEGLIAIKNDSSISFSGFVDHFQIDNNSNTPTQFPVVFRRLGRGIRHNVEKKRFLEWKVGLEDPSKSSHLYFSNLTIVLGNTEVTLEEEFLDKLIEYTSSISGLMKAEAIKTNFDFVKKKHFDILQIEDNFDYNKKIWEFVEVDTSNNYVYIDNLNLSQIRCLVSYYQDASSTLDKDFQLVSLIGVAVGGFENARIDLKGYHQK